MTASKPLRRFDDDTEQHLSFHDPNMTPATRDLLGWAWSFKNQMVDLGDPSDPKDILDWACELYPEHRERDPKEVAKELWESGES